MRGPSWLVAAVTFLLEIIAFGLAVGAMTRRSQATAASTDQYEYCSYTSTVASGLAAGAVILLLAGHALVMGITGCFCCKSGTSTGKGRACAIIAFSLAWFCFIISELLLVSGAKLNKVHTTRRIPFTDGGSYPLTCKEIRKSVFAAAAAFSFLTLLFSEIYYFSLMKSSDGSYEQSYKTGAPTISMTSYP